ncbi:MAG: biotin--[acetyl-CoA-carboxylase] ligase [Planctomycetota bacterium]
MRFQQWQIHERDSVSSTQREVRDLLSDVTTTQVALVAAEQRDGHGRQGREWVSPIGGLWCSLAVRTQLPVDPFHTLLLALAARDAVAECVAAPPQRLRLKWPNDLVTGAPAERKWGGILAEVHPLSAAESWVIFGLGVNLDLPLARLPQTGPEHLPATSIRVEFGSSPSPQEALLAILSRFDEFRRLDQQASPDSTATGRRHTLALAEAALSTLGRAVTWRDATHVRRRGNAVGLATNGGLIVESQDGTRQELRAGDIQHLRPADEA